MNKIIRTMLLVIGIMFNALGTTILSDHKTLQYLALFLGLIISIYSVFSDKLKKAQEEIKIIQLHTRSK